MMLTNKLEYYSRFEQAPRVAAALSARLGVSDSGDIDHLIGGPIYIRVSEPVETLSNNDSWTEMSQFLIPVLEEMSSDLNGFIEMLKAGNKNAIKEWFEGAARIYTGLKTGSAIK